jgi:hypothetical protein
MSNPLRSAARHARKWLGTSGLEWWPELVAREFGFLRDYGYELADSHIHFQGNYVSFKRSDSEIVVSFEPESTGILDTEILLLRTREPTPIDVDQLILNLIPGSRVPVKKPLTREVVEAYVRLAARGLRSVAPALLDGPIGSDSLLEPPHP